MEKSNKITFWLLIIALVFAYVRPYEFIPLIEKFKVTKVSLFGALLFSFLEKYRKGYLLRETSFRYFLLLEVLAFVMIPFSIWPANSLDFWMNSYIKAFMVFYLILLVTVDRRRFDTLVKVIFICTSIVALRTAMAFFSGNVAYDSDGTRRVIGISILASNNANDLALALAMVVPLGMYFAFIGKATLKKVFYLGLTALNMLALLFTGSRGGYLGLLLGMAAFLFLKYRDKKVKLVLGILLAAVIVVPLLPGDYKSRFSSTFDSSDYSYQDEKTGRLAIWKRGVESFIHGPLGSGLKTYTITEGRRRREEGIVGKWHVAHNSYIEVAVELGAMGIALYLLILLSGFKNIGKILAVADGDNTTRVCAYAFASSMVAFAVSSLFLSQAYYWNVYIFIALITALKNITTGAPDNGQRALA